MTQIASKKSLIRNIFLKGVLGAFLIGAIFFYFQEDLTLPDSYIGQDVPTILAAMPKRDRKVLHHFFRRFIGWDQGGYVLLGKKPMTLNVVTEKIDLLASLSEFYHWIIPRRIKCEKSFRIWKKYEKFFPLSKYVILYEKEDNGNLSMMFINKRAFIQTIEEHAEDFQKILTREITGETLLEEARCKPLVSGLLKNHHGLLGILLGYGRNNAYLYHQKEQLKSLDEVMDFIEKHNLKSVWTDEEVQHFIEQFEGVGRIKTYITGSHLDDLNLMAPPSFAAVFDLPETRQWRQEYIETKQNIIDFYEGKDFLQATLELLTEKEEYLQPTAITQNATANL